MKKAPVNAGAFFVAYSMLRNEKGADFSAPF
jgi:hypothetical protein